MKVLHMLHDLDLEVGSIGSTVRKGFKWANMLPLEEIVLCVCRDRCVDGEMCGRSTAQQVFGENLFRTSEGHYAFDDLWSCDNCQATGLGRVTWTWVGRFLEIPARLIANEHEERSRSYTGLLASMTKAYSKLFSEMDFVTVLEYRRIS